MTPAQSRAARALIGWSQPQLAESASVSISTIRDFETGKRAPIPNNLAAIRAALEAAGVEFINGTGVKLKPLHPSVVDGQNRSDASTYPKGSD
jgi:transcriptional regulator with XRE-family HTH domain